MSVVTRLTVTVDRLYHHARLPAGIWLPFLACLVMVGLTSLGSVLGLSGNGLRDLSGDPARPGAMLGARMMLADKDPRLNPARAVMLRREYAQCRVADDGLHRALIARDDRAVAQWQARCRTVRSSYALIAAQSTDHVFAATGLPRRF